MPSINSNTIFSSAPRSLNFRGSFSPSLGSFPGSLAPGDLWVADDNGTIDSVSFANGDSLYALVANASATTFAANYTKIESNSDVVSVFGRTGAVDFQEGDAALGELGDVDLTVAPTNGQVLQFNSVASQWVPGTAASGASGFKGIAATFAAARALPAIVPGDYVWITSDGDPNVLPEQRRGAFRKVFGATPALSTSWSGPYGWVANSPQMFSSDQMFSSNQMFTTA